jgi:predicted N-formylglutamate amidohydrolase
MVEPAILISCEHAVNSVPMAWRQLFEDNEDVLASHRGWDRGAVDLAHCLAESLSAPCLVARVSRMLIDHNRSPHNPGLWSEFTRELPAKEKERVVEEYYAPFRREAADWIAAQHADGRQILHLSVHTFTPVYEGKEREVDVGLLYDPGRPEESYFASRWKSHLLAARPQLRVRCNVPYRGRSDSHLSGYREQYPSRNYIGFELEVNQVLTGSGVRWSALQKTIAASLVTTLQEVSIDE